MIKRFILLNIAIISCNYVSTHFYSIYGSNNKLFEKAITTKNLVSSDNIGLLSIFSVDKNTTSSSNYVGHAFISIENISPNSSFLIGKLALNSNDSPLSAGFINTPSNLKKSIMKHSYSIDLNIPYDYRIGYYKNGIFNFSSGSYSLNSFNDDNPYSM